MTSRTTRPERDRFELAIAQEKQRAVTALEIILLVTGGMAAGVAAIVYALADDVSLAVGGAGVGGVLGLVYSTALGWDLARAALTRQPEAERDDNRVGRIAPRHWITAADGWTWNEQRDYLIAVRDGATGFSQRAAMDWGNIEADKFNALLRRMVDLGLYKTNNAERYDNRNQGVWSDEGREMLAYLDDDEQRPTSGL